MSKYGLPYWLDLERPQFPSLDRDITADVAVIGAGIAGLKLAGCLNRYGINTVILEGSRVGNGASSRNQGCINHGPAMDYVNCIRHFSRDIARDLWQMGLENHRLLLLQIQEYGIECDYHIDGSTTLVRRDMEGWEEQLDDLRKEFALLHEDGFEVSLLDEQDAVQVGGSPLYAGGLCYLADAQFHSGKYVLGLAQNVALLPNVDLFELTRVERIEKDGSGVRLATDHGTLSAGQVFLSTNALVPQFIPALEQALRAERGQVMVTEPLPERPCRGCFGTTSSGTTGAWWREIIESGGEFRLLFGGGRDREEPDSLFPQFTTDGKPHPKLESEGFNPSIEHQNRLNTQFAKLFPKFRQARITHRWGGLQSFTADNLPVVGILDAELKIYGMAGFCGRGNCHSDVGAEYLAGLVAGVESDTGKRFGSLIEKIMKVQRKAANWGPWHTNKQLK